MHCYICEHSEVTRGTRFAIKEAIGVCHECGIGVCVKHSDKAEGIGSPLLCPECAKLAQKTTEAKKELEPVLSSL